RAGIPLYLDKSGSGDNMFNRLLWNLLLSAPLAAMLAAAVGYLATSQALLARLGTSVAIWFLLLVVYHVIRRGMLIQRRRLALSPGDVWITYRLSRDLYSAGQRSQADTLMRQLARQKPSDPDQIYANGLYLSGNDQDRAALAHLDTLPRSQWNGNI
ncbi:hypothetical protein, partial [Escherichia coli]|uniref:hypothetical protein n=1 Tax=Escherichia coli TaxID=562 RepID=UPI001E58CDC6